MDAEHLIGLSFDEALDLPHTGEAVGAWFWFVLACALEARRGERKAAA